MDPFEDLILNDIDEEIMTDLEKETLYNEYLYDETLLDDIEDGGDIF